MREEPYVPWSTGARWVYWGAGKQGQWWCSHCGKAADEYWRCAACRLQYCCTPCAKSEAKCTCMKVALHEVSPKADHQWRVEEDWRGAACTGVRADVSGWDWNRQRDRKEVRRQEASVARVPSSLGVAKYSAVFGDRGWEDRAVALFLKHGFVVVERALEQWRCVEVLRDCEEVEKEIVGPERRGNRGPGRYSMGVASCSGGMLHSQSFAWHLLDAAGSRLRPVLDRIFEGGRLSGFTCLGAGGDFVLGGVETYQDLHADMHVKKEHNVRHPPPMLSVNFAVEDLTDSNGPTRIVPGTQLWGTEPLPAPEPEEWRRSRLAPVPAGAAILRDVRVLHGGTPNFTQRTRFLPSVEYVSADFRASQRADCFPPPRSLPSATFDGLRPATRELCGDIVAWPGQCVRPRFWRC